MSLDWCVWERREREGMFLVFWRLTGKLAALEKDDSLPSNDRAQLRRDLEKALEQVSVSAYEIIQAPRDAETGRYRPEFARRRDGLGRSIGCLASPVDFRGECVAVSPVLPESLREEAYSAHSPSGCIDYSQRLEAALDAVPAERRLEFAGEIEAVRAAITWLRFWGTAGFGFDEWF